MESFRAKTATNAQQRLKQERAEKKKSDEAAKAQERERLLRAKEYGSKSRELAVRKAQQKKKEKKDHNLTCTRIRMRLLPKTWPFSTSRT